MSGRLSKSSSSWPTRFNGPGVSGRQRRSLSSTPSSGRSATTATRRRSPRASANCGARTIDPRPRARRPTRCAVLTPVPEAANAPAEPIVGPASAGQRAVERVGGERARFPRGDDSVSSATRGLHRRLPRRPRRRRRRRAVVAVGRNAGCPRRSAGSHGSGRVDGTGAADAVNAGVAAPAPAAAAPAGPPRALNIEFITVRPVWARDHRRRPARHRTGVHGRPALPVRRRPAIVIRAGDAGAFRLIVDGKDLGVLGRDGQVFERAFTRRRGERQAQGSRLKAQAKPSTSCSKILLSLEPEP